jgi:hypothetical protein
MFKKITIFAVFASLPIAVLFGTANNTFAKIASNEFSSRYGGQGKNSYHDDDAGSWSGQFGCSNQGSNSVNGYAEIAPVNPEELTASDREALILMREEEKLAHDVYLVLYHQWGATIFQNISRSEQTHTEAVKSLLDAYQIADPASGQLGEFTNPELQALYDELVERGSRSLTDALRVGAAIEEIDILDLQQRTAGTENSSVSRFFNNLLQDSFHHLNAFTITLLTQSGEAYQPQYMTMENYQALQGAGPIGNGMRHGGTNQP